MKKEKIYYDIRSPAADRGTHKPQLRLDKDDKITEITPKDFDSQPTSKYLGFYDMKSKRHGVALIISNKNFKDKREHIVRRGTERDEHNLSETWQFLGYHVIILRDCTRDEMVRTFKEIDKPLKKAAQSERVANDSFVCCILTHGLEGVVFGTDSEALPHNKIQESLATSKILRSKPKLLFIQACQGETSLLHSPAIQDLGNVSVDGDYISLFTDFYLACASVYGFVAMRNTINGEFLPSLCWEGLVKLFVHDMCRVLPYISSKSNIN